MSFEAYPLRHRPFAVGCRLPHQIDLRAGRIDCHSRFWPSRFSPVSKKPKVLDSFQTVDGLRCVDIFVREDETYGFTEYRHDPENGSRWFTLRDFSGQVFGTREDALAAARKSVQWLSESTDIGS